MVISHTLKHSLTHTQTHSPKCMMNSIVFLTRRHIPIQISNCEILRWKKRDIISSLWLVTGDWWKNLLRRKVMMMMMMNSFITTLIRELIFISWNEFVWHSYIYVLIWIWMISVWVYVCMFVCECRFPLAGYRDTRTCALLFIFILPLFVSRKRMLIICNDWYEISFDWMIVVENSRRKWLSQNYIYIYTSSHNTH